MRKYILCLVFLWRANAQSSSVVTMLPSDGATGVPLNARIVAALAYPATYSLTPFKVTKAGAAVSGATQLPDFSFGISTPPGAFGWIGFTPDKPLDPKTVYKVEVDTPGLPPFFASFTTGTAADNAPPLLISSTPSPGQDGVNTTGSMTLRFNKPLSPFSFKQGQFSVRDLSSGGAATDIYFLPQMQESAPIVETVLQSPGTIRIQFSRPVNPLTVRRGGIRLRRSDETPVNFTVQTSLDRKQIILVPASSVGPLTLELDGVQSRTGEPFPAMVRRL